jgi:hypothetical protein
LQFERAFKPVKTIRVSIWQSELNQTETKNDGSDFRLVCECFGVLGGYIWHYVQGDQRLGLCHHLADTDDCASSGHRLAVAEDLATFEKELKRIIKLK